MIDVDGTLEKVKDEGEIDNLIGGLKELIKSDSYKKNKVFKNDKNTERVEDFINALEVLKYNKDAKYQLDVFEREKLIDYIKGENQNLAVYVR